MDCCCALAWPILVIDFASLTPSAHGRLSTEALGINQLASVFLIQLAALTPFVYGTYISRKSID